MVPVLGVGINRAHRLLLCSGRSKSSFISDVTAIQMSYTEDESGIDAKFGINA